MMLIPDILEAVMLFFFSIGWYWSIARMIRCGQTTGKSVTFVIMVSIGYLFGVISQIARNLQGDGSTMLLAIYAWNFAVVVFDLVLVIWLSRRAAAGSRKPAAA